MNRLTIMLIAVFILWLVQLILYREHSDCREAIFALTQYALIGLLCIIFGELSLDNVASAFTIFSALATMLTSAGIKIEHHYGHESTFLDIKSPLFTSCTGIGLGFSVLLLLFSPFLN